MDKSKAVDTANTIFTKIINKEVPAVILHEDEKVDYIVAHMLHGTVVAAVQHMWAFFIQYTDVRNQILSGGDLQNYIFTH